jgi:protein O-mannosyl-transferase
VGTSAYILNKSNSFLLIIAILLLPFGVFFLYAPGLSAGFSFDDYPNLETLSSVMDFESAMGFVLEPKGGPLGRHLALASFLVNTPSWGVAPEDFIYTNICIHLLNGMLLIWLSLRVACLAGEARERAGWLAFFVGAIWLLQPINVSASLMVVQRMTTLAMTFGLIGLLVFVRGVEVLSTSRRHGYVLMSLGVGFGTALGMFTKENGVLLPLLILILQSTILRGATQGFGSGFHRWRTLFLVVPSAVIFAYLLYQLPGMPVAYERRDFTLEQRVLTEARILLRYLGLVLFPVRAEIGPFQDDYPLSTGLFEPPTTALAILLIGLLVSLAVGLRRRVPVFSFAILWFFAGHLLESTIIPLEIYFEHRNYVPSIGPVVAMVYLGFRIRRPVWAGPVVLSIYTILMAWVCFSAASVFGDKFQSAILWNKEHPNSVRATQNLALAYAINGQFDSASRIVAEFADRRGREVGLVVQSLQLSCVAGSATARMEKLRSRPELLSSGHLNSNICDGFEKTSKLVLGNACIGVTEDDLHWIAEQIRQNSQMVSAREINYCLHDLQAMLYFNERDFGKTMEHLDAAYEYRKYWSLVERMIEVPVSAGRVDLARENLERARQYVPGNPFYARIWQRNIQKYEKLLNGYEAAKGSQ